MQNLFSPLLLAIRNCKKWILIIFSFYCISCLTGIVMVHAGNKFALSCGDKIVANAVANDSSTINYLKDNKFRAAVFDFGGNLCRSALPQTLMGLSVIIPFFTTPYQGWVGGIVSVDGLHRSRLTKIKPACYYFIVLILQLVPFSLVIGAGLALGIKTYHLNKGRTVLQYRIDKRGLKDVLLIYLVAIPLFFLASCFEFLSTWNN